MLWAEWVSTYSDKKIITFLLCKLWNQSLYLWINDTLGYIQSRNHMKIMNGWILLTWFLDRPFLLAQGVQIISTGQNIVFYAISSNLKNVIWVRAPCRNEGNQQLRGYSIHIWSLLVRFHSTSSPLPVCWFISGALSMYL